MSILDRPKEWWMKRADKEPMIAMGAGRPCLCVFAIKQTDGQPVVHDPRCPQGSALPMT